MTLNLPTTQVEPLQKLLADLSRGRVHAQLLDA
jgi:hypothetical protein